MTEAQDYVRRRWIALILLCFAQFIVVLDASIVNIALPSIGEALDFSQANLPWVVNAYILSFGGFLLLGGRIADFLGRRRVFIAGLLLVASSSLAAGFAGSEGQLIAARAVQGLGGAMITPAALSIITNTFSDGAERNKALGAWGAVAAAGGAAGVLLGGIITDGLGWEWALWVNVPIALAVALLAPGLVADSRSGSPVRHFDTAGAVSVTVGLTAFVYALLDVTDAGWGSVQTLGLLALSASLIAVFVVIERSSDAPIVPFRIFRLRTLTGANAVGLVVGATFYSAFFFVTLYMQQVLGYSPIEAGLSYLPLTASLIIGSVVASQLVTRIGFKPVLAIGMALVIVAFVWFSEVSVEGGYTTDILGPSIIGGVGMTFAFVTTTIAAVSGVREQDSGLASGLINSSVEGGGALGLAVLATVAMSRTNDLAESSGGDPAGQLHALTEGFQSAFLGGAAFAALGLVLTLILIRNRDSRAHVELGARPQQIPA
jgi:EmrB/QacA subfamily drug resistance transporter